MSLILSLFQIASFLLKPYLWQKFSQVQIQIKKTLVISFLFGKNVSKWQNVLFYIIFQMMRYSHLWHKFGFLKTKLVFETNFSTY